MAGLLFAELRLQSYLSIKSTQKHNFAKKTSVEQKLTAKPKESFIIIIIIMMKDYMAKTYVSNKLKLAKDK